MIVGNFYVRNVDGNCELEQRNGDEKVWVWLAFHCSAGELRNEHLALTFTFREFTVMFKHAVERAEGLRWPVPTLGGQWTISTLTLLEHVLR